MDTHPSIALLKRLKAGLEKMGEILDRIDEDLERMQAEEKQAEIRNKK